MDSSKRVTSIFIAIALFTLAALAINVNRRQPADAEPDMSVLPGLAENLRSVEKLTGYPLANIRVVKITRTNGNVTLIARPDYASGFQFRTEPAESEKAAYSAILYANATFMDELGTAADSFVVTGAEPEQQLGQIGYTGFDGLALENTVFRANNATWLKMATGYSAKLAADEQKVQSDKLLSADEVNAMVSRLQGRIYKKPDEEQQ